MPDVTLVLRDTTAAEDLVSEAIDSEQTSLIASRIMALKAQAQLNHGGLGAAGRSNHSHTVTRDGINVFTVTAEPAWVSRTLTYKAPGGAVLDTVVCADRATYRQTLQRFKVSVETNPTFSYTDLPT